MLSGEKPYTQELVVNYSLLCKYKKLPAVVQAEMENSLEAKFKDICYALE